MKIKILSLIAALAWSSVPVIGQFSTVNLTTLTTNTVTENGTMTIPAAGITNDSATFNRTNVVKGDQTAVAFAKVNANFEFVRTNGIKIFVPTNLPVGSRWVTNGQYVMYATNISGLANYTFIPTNLPVGTPWVTNGTILLYPTNVTSFGSGTDTNKVPIYDGGATNLTVTNTFKLTSTTPYYTVSTVTFTNGSWGNTNQDGTYYASDGSYGPGSLTNSNGDVIFVSDITSNLQTRVSRIWVTNGVGSGYYYPISKTYAIFTNITLTVTTNGSSTNYISYGNGTPGQAIYNVIAVVSGAGTAGFNGTYASGYSSYADAFGITTNVGQTIFDTYVINSGVTYRVDNGNVGSNPDGSSSFKLTTSSSVYYYIQTNLTVGKPLSNGVPYQTTASGGTAPAPTVTFYYSFASGSPTYTATTNSSTNAVYNWAYYSTNAWRFFSNTNAVFVPDSETIIVDATPNLFYVTNVAFVPDSSVTYYANNTNPVIFSTTNDYELSFYDPPHYWFDSIPGTGSVAFSQVGTNAGAISALTNGGFYNTINGLTCDQAYSYNMSLILRGKSGTFNYTCGNGSVVTLFPNVHTIFNP